MVDDVGIWNIHGFGRMGKNKRIEDHHHRQENLFGDFRGLNDRVKNLLVALAINLQPAGVPLG